MLNLKRLGSGLFTALALASEADGGAWTRAAGDGQLIISSGSRVAPVGAFAVGSPEDDSNTTQILVEYGLIEGLTVGATVFAEFSSSDINNSTLNAGIFARKRLWQGEQGVFSVQVGYAHPFEETVGEQFGGFTSDSAPEIELRLLYGHSFWGDWGSAFLSLETGYDRFGKGEDDEFRADATVGYEPYHCCLALFSVFTTVPTGDDEASFRIAPSFAYTLWPDVPRNGKKPTGPIRPRTLQFGINYDLLNHDDGLGMQVSIWQSF